ncbi:7d9472be-761a-4431-b752-9b38df12824b [Thermothielavioides terrestris]|uniref:Geranylgeranyl transferase type-2 subunit alpha n=1 Tax=Thermothielavioides terrestris TaxID=2587410 RepID=A0A446BCV7_9PEZI|nr:7d9472be-761a-4431-b752-9b38df12824b [Thermothielavioides terrestris]
MADQGGSQHGIARTSRVRSEEQKQRDLQRIQKYRELEDQVRSHVSRADYSPQLFQLTSKLLRLNPEYYTLWNTIGWVIMLDGVLEYFSYRHYNTIFHQLLVVVLGHDPARPRLPDSWEECGDPARAPTADSTDSAAAAAAAAAEQQDLATIQSELSFTIPLLLESPKCYWIWSYRQWILAQAIARLRPHVARQVWEAELGLASKMLGKDRRNFHAWGYRRHVVAQLESAALRGTSMVEAEFEYTYRMIQTDLSNFSAWHSRSKLIPRLLDERGADDAARRAFLDKELNQIREALNVGPEDQSLWYYHQFLMLNLVDPDKHPAMTRGIAARDRAAYLAREIDEIKELLEDYPDVKLIYEALFEYTLYLCQLEDRQPTADERADLAAWLAKLKELDPMRNGRWADLERECGL